MSFDTPDASVDGPTVGRDAMAFDGSQVSSVDEDSSIMLDAGETGSNTPDSMAMDEAGPPEIAVSCPMGCANYQYSQFWVCADKHPTWCNDIEAASDILLCDDSTPMTEMRCPAGEACISGGMYYSDYCNPCGPTDTVGCIAGGNPATQAKPDIRVDCNEGRPSNPTICESGCVNCDAPK